MTMTIGIIGCGNIAPQYAKTLNLYPEDAAFKYCADMDMKRAQQFSSAYGLEALSVDDLLASGEVDLLINLTVPDAHKEVSMAIIAAGKHVYSEKPLALALDDGKAILAAAEEAGVRVGCAPDTVLGAGIQNARRLIDTGEIGLPVSATAFFANHGPEPWHPNPFFYYKEGGGPMLDMGPYYLTALVTLLGPAALVNGIVGQAFTERIANHESIRGQKIPVTTATHYAGTVGFVNGAIATVITSFDVWKHHLPFIQVHGTNGSLSLPDPNHFDGVTELWVGGSDGWQQVDMAAPTVGGRGIGAVDMVRSITAGENHRANGEIGLHVLEMMLAFSEAAEQEKTIQLESRPERPAAASY